MDRDQYKKRGVVDIKNKTIRVSDIKSMESWYGVENNTQDNEERMILYYTDGTRDHFNLGKDSYSYDTCRNLRIDKTKEIKDKMNYWELSKLNLKGEEAMKGVDKCR